MHMLRGPISRQLMLSIAILVALTFALGYLAYYHVQNIGTAVTDTMANADARYLRTRLRVESLILSDLAHEHVLQMTPDEKARIRTQFGESEQRIEVLLEQAIKVATIEDRGQVEETKAKVQAFVTQATRLMEINQQESGYGVLTQAALTQLISQRGPMLDSVRQLEENETNRLDKTRRKANDDVQQARTTILAGVITTLVIGLVIGLINIVFILAPLTNLRRGVEQIASGQLDITLALPRKDEFGALAQALNTMTYKVRHAYDGLEQQVEARTAQLQAGAEVARAASSILAPQELLQKTVDLICDRFGYHYAAIFLLDEENAAGQPRYARLRAGRGEAGRRMRAAGHKFEMGSGMVGWVCANRQPRIALDVGQDAVRFANPLLSETRSEIALPLQAGEHTQGALDVQSNQPGAFDQNDIVVLQGMADQIAVALENARLFEQAQASLEQNEQLITQIQTSLKETSALYMASQAIALAQDKAGIFQAIVDNVLKPDVDVCFLIIFDSYKSDLPEYLEITSVWDRQGAASALIGRRFDMLHFPLRAWLQPDKVSIVSDPSQIAGEPAAYALWERLGIKAGAFVPLSTRGQWIGALGLGVCGNTSFEEDELRSYQAVTVQAATALENLRLVESTQTSLQELSAMYRAYTGDAWAAALQAQSKPAGYEYIRAEASREGGGTSPDHVLHIPLVVREHEIGLLELENQGRGWTEQERAFVEAVSTQAALALDGARLFEQTQRQAGRERLINQITARIRAANSISDILATAARELAAALDVPHAVARVQVADIDRSQAEARPAKVQE